MIQTSPVTVIEFSGGRCSVHSAPNLWSSVVFEGHFTLIFMLVDLKISRIGT